MLEATRKYLSSGECGDEPHPYSSNRTAARSDRVMTGPPLADCNGKPQSVHPKQLAGNLRTCASGVAGTREPTGTIGIALCSRAFSWHTATPIDDQWRITLAGKPIGG